MFHQIFIYIILLSIHFSLLFFFSFFPGTFRMLVTDDSDFLVYCVCCMQVFIEKTMLELQLSIRFTFADVQYCQKQPCKMFFKKIIRNFIIFTGKHLCCSLILIKMQAIYIFFVWNTSSGCFCLVQVKGFLRFHKANSEVGFSWKVFSNKKSRTEIRSEFTETVTWSCS